MRGAELTCNDDTVGCGTTTDLSNPHRGSRLAPSVVAGHTYFIVVDGYAGKKGDYSLTVTPPGPPTGACASPTVVPPEGGTFSGTTHGASTQSSSCGATGTSPENAYAWTPGVSGVATIETCSTTATTYDTVLYVRGASCSGAELACNDDTPGCGTTTDVSNPHRGSRLKPTVTAGQTYFIFVDGYGGSLGAYSLHIAPPIEVPPQSGTCAQPIAIPAAGGTFTGTTTGSSALASNCGATGSSPELVYAWTPSDSGVATIATCSATATTYDTVLYVRDGSCAGSELGCNDDTSGCGTTTDLAYPHRGSRLTPAVTEGHTYFIVVDGYAGASGDFSLSVSLTPNLCHSPYSECSSVCVDLQTDRNNCGSCGHYCPSNNQWQTYPCSEGTCLACGVGFLDCDHLASNGCEVNSFSDVNNCGGCGVVCPGAAGSALCDAKVCALCPAGVGNCDGKGACETDLLANANHCGACGNVCPTGKFCENGSCVDACTAPYVACDRGCVDLQTNVQHCGSCDLVCSSIHTTSCTAGSCVTCQSSYADCDGVASNGCEVSLSSRNNCGSCGSVCSDAQYCLWNLVHGHFECAPCEEGHADCDGLPGTILIPACETDLRSDASNCGACGVVCSSGQTCSAGVCQ